MDTLELSNKKQQKSAEKTEEHHLMPFRAVYIPSCIMICFRFIQYERTKMLDFFSDVFCKTTLILLAIAHPASLGAISDAGRCCICLYFSNTVTED